MRARAQAPRARALNAGHAGAVLLAAAAAALAAAALAGAVAEQRSGEPTVPLAAAALDVGIPGTEVIGQGQSARTDPVHVVDTDGGPIAMYIERATGFLAGGAACEETAGDVSGLGISQKILRDDPQCTTAADFFNRNADVIARTPELDTFPLTAAGTVDPQAPGTARVSYAVEFVVPSDALPKSGYNMTVRITPQGGGTQGTSARVDFSVTVAEGLPGGALPGNATSPDGPVAVSVRDRGGDAVSVRDRGGDAGPGATYTSGQTIILEVEFPAPVTVRSQGAGGGGTPYLELRAGSAGARAAYESGSGTDTLRFAYAVRAGDVTGRLSYAGTLALALNGSAITAPGTGASVSTLLPAPGSAGSLSGGGGPPVRIVPPDGRPVLGVGVLDEAGPNGDVSAAAYMAAAAFNELRGRAPPGAAPAPLLNVSFYDAGTTPGSAAGALRGAHASGAGPSVFVGPSTDRGLHAAMPYARDNGIVLLSAGSTAPSLGAAGDTVFRMLPSDAQQARALSRLVADTDAESAVVIVDSAAYPEAAAAAGGGAFSHGLGPAVSGDMFLPSSTVVLSGPPSGWGGAAADAAAKAKAGDAVVFLGAGDALASFARHAPGLGHMRWFASDAAAGSPALLVGDAAALAAATRLTAVSYAAPAGPAALAVDGYLSAAGTAGTAAVAAAAGAGGGGAGADMGGKVPPAARYAAYDAMAVVAEAAAAATAAGAGLSAQSLASQIPPAAAGHEGALGDVLLDAAGDLWLPNLYDAWTVRAGQGGAPEWSVQPAGARGIDSCSIRLGSSALDMRVNLGGYSTVASQTVVNSGSQEYKSVQLLPTPWYIDPDGRPAPGHPSLPASLAELSRTGPRGAYEALADRDTHVAAGLPPGGQDRLWFRVNLTGHAESPGGSLVQYVTYVAECAASR